jgi:hypothetical protein
LSDRAAIQRERAAKFYEKKNIEQANVAQEIASQAERDAQMMREIIERL